ncbi:ABC transporter permease subunit [Alkalibaculum sp. M08DMB]|uniref:ABC transporter permease subunit n=1 Tax=Alkalibaculum sporogenes TaxID=2655001 RepID=A0A6A7K605_9FIRM|nr:ABC transporter permease [Alkalibaculum sporogenes]MPW24919.1 ABC transporter permease subunit [Alkalibaculum sporogenes]
MHKNPFSFQLNSDDFLPAKSNEDLVREYKKTSYWNEIFHSFLKKKVALIAFVVIVFVFFLAFTIPLFYEYSYDQQIRGSENLRPFEYSEQELNLKSQGETVVPHLLGTDTLGRDVFIRVLMGTRISLIVGIVASIIVLVIGAIYGSIAGFFGGKLDLIMMRIVDVIYTVPDILIIILLSVSLREPLNVLYEKNLFFSQLEVLGPGLTSIFITFSLLYWVGMARIIRAQVVMLKEQEYIIAAKALGASNTRIITKHLLPNLIGTIIVTTTLQIPTAIFTESFLSFIGLGVAAPMPSLGSLAADAMGGINSYTYRLIAPTVAISVIILSFNLFGDGLQEVFDPKLKEKR